jgi:hypothetical protein
MAESAAIDQVTEEIALDDRVSPTAVRLYLLLRNGKSLDAAATAMGRNVEWMKRYERQLRDLGYIEVHLVQTRGKRRKKYAFPIPPQTSLAAS